MPTFGVLHARKAGGIYVRVVIWAVLSDLSHATYL